MNTTLKVNFSDQEIGVTGSAEIETKQHDDETIYLARNIQFDNTDEELLNSGLVIEPELRIRNTYNAVEERIHWLDADTGEETEMAILIGQAIEKATCSIKRHAIPQILKRLYSLQRI